MEWKVGPGRLLGARFYNPPLLLTSPFSLTDHLPILRLLLTQTFFGSASSTLYWTADPVKGSETVFWVISTIGSLCDNSDNLLSYNPMGLPISREPCPYCPPGPWRVSQALNSLALVQDLQILRLGTDTDLACSLQPWLCLFEQSVVSLSTLGVFDTFGRPLVVALTTHVPALFVAQNHIQPRPCWHLVNRWC